MRLSSSQRQEQIVQAALELLAEHSVDRLTTRRVAARIGISQPALFRHFASREEILIAVLDHVRASLGAEATCILASGLGAREAVQALMTVLLDYVRAHPGMPRLLFYDAATSVDDTADSTLRPRLRQLLEMQCALIGELLARAREEGQLPAGVDPVEAAGLLITLMQGRILALHLGREDRMDTAGLAALLDFYWKGLEAWGTHAVEEAGGALELGGGSGTDRAQGPSSERRSQDEPSEALIHFDAREDLGQGRDPFDSIRSRVAGLRPEGLMVLEVPFLPEPLLALLSSEGWTCEVEVETGSRATAPGGAAEANYQIRIRGAAAPGILDLRDLEPPEPMVVILERSSGLGAGEVLLARLPRVPRLLLPRLEERGLRHECIETRDGGVYLALRLPDAAEEGPALDESEPDAGSPS